MRNGLKSIFLFFTSFIIIFGESYKVISINPSVVILFLLIILFLATNLKKLLLYFRSIEFFIGFFIIFFYLIFGVANNKFAYVKEDLFPFFCLFISYNIVVTVYSDIKDIYDSLYVIMIVSSLVVFKVLIINFAEVQTEWGGETFWQGSKNPVSGFFNRIILKGADVFIIVSVIYFYIVFLYKKNYFYLLPLLMSIISVVMSFTRTSILLLVSMLLLLGIFSKKGILKKIQFLIFLALVFIFLYVGFDAIGLTSAYTERSSGAGSGNMSLGWRQLESFLVLQKSSENNFLGNGFGSTFEMFLSGSNKEDSLSLYVHNLYLWFILKTGILGLLYYIYLIFKYFIIVFKLIGDKQPLFYCDTRYKILTLFCLASLSFLVLNDLVNNKFITLSGSVLYGIIFGIISFIKNINEKFKILYPKAI